MTLAACNSNPSANTAPVQDTTGLSAFQQQRMQNLAAAELDTQAATPAVQPAVVRPVRTTPRRSTSSSSSGSGSTASTSGSGTTEAAVPAKKGISKTAKGAIIGGTAGAVGGALINKKNRGAGAVIGGIIGAGAGAVIGNQADKKDGRH
ncbi:MAG: glycine zipper 2TM domain-containing protein [Chitinophagaceae bacterium]|nr:MAG: glycine zipper 2TM domain-containing protein [Chitinophagaceae bacterium]